MPTGMGTTVTFGTSSFTLSKTEVSTSGESRDAIETTHLGTTGYKTFIPADLVDGGEMTIRGQFLGDETPPISGAAETATIDWSGQGVGYTSAASVFCTNVDRSAQIGPNLMEITLTYKVAGAWTHSA
jgi:hypothetical protein